MKRRLIEQTNIEHEDAKVDNFIDDIIAVYKKHGLSLTFEDWDNGFIVDKLSEDNVAWLQNTFISKNVL